MHQRRRIARVAIAADASPPLPSPTRNLEYAIGSTHLLTMEIVKANRAGGLIRELEAAAAGASRLEDWIRELKSAEASAKAARLSIRLYQANYRVKDESSKTKGDPDQRRDALVAMLRSMSPNERHRGTSTWIFQLHIADATTIANLLAPPLDTAVDFLAVAELTANRTTVGDAKLKS